MMTRLIDIFLFLSIFTSQALAQDRQLTDAAKKEGGKVVVYGTLEQQPAAEVQKAFERRTGIVLEYWRASATKVLDRSLTEYRAGKPMFEVVIGPPDAMRIMRKEGIFAKYDSPSAKDFSKDAIDPALGPSYRNFIIGILYNKSVIRPADAPTSIEDLVKPQYRGKLVMPDPTQHTTTIQWLANLHKVMRKEKVDKYVRDLASAKPMLVESFVPAAERVVTGERPIGISFVKYVYLLGKEGAPLDYVRLGKMLGDGHHIALSNKAPRPNAGKAFIDYFLGEESMRIMAGMGEFVNRKGIYPPIPEAEKIQFVQMDQLDKEGYSNKKKEYRTIFFQ